MRQFFWVDNMNPPRCYFFVFLFDELAIEDNPAAIYRKFHIGTRDKMLARLAASPTGGKLFNQPADKLIARPIRQPDNLNRQHLLFAGA